MNSPNRNVFHQNPKTEIERKKLDGLKPDFCLYLTSQSHLPEVIIETKKPNMNLNSTKEQALKYANILGASIIVLFDGIRTKSYWVNNQEELLDNNIGSMSF